jgi:hypothetical protein
MKILLRHLAKSQLWVPVDPGLLVAALLALFAIVPILAHSGLPNTADGPVHLMRQVELNQAWQDGILYPRWAPDLAYGYGMPLFHYAPPLLYYVTQVIHLSGLPLDASMKGTLVLMMLLYSVGMYLFARDLFGPRAGLLAAAAYLYAPYRLREAYIQGNYGQFCGLAFYPLILWSFLGLITTRRSRYLPLAALSLAGLLLSHNISAMIFGPLLGAYLVFLWVATRPLRKSGNQEGRLLDSAPSSFLRPVSAIGLGLGLSAFFWLPAFGERDLIRLAGITSGFFDFRHNFIDLAELLALPRPLDLSAINPYYPLSLGLVQMALTGLALLGLGLYYVLRIRNLGASAVDGRVTGARGRATHHALFFAAALLTTGFLTLPYSRPIWETVPLLELAEFPWRFLGPALLCAGVLAGAALYLFERPGTGQDGLGKLGVGLFVTLAASLFYLFPAQFIPWGTPSPADAVTYEAESGAIGTTSAGEFLPRWADRYPSPEVLGPDYAAGRLPTKLDPASLPEGGRATTLSHTAHETRVAVSSPDPFVGTFRALYWPGWRVIVAEGTGGNAYQVTDIQITQPDGLIRVRLPAGEYQVSLRLVPTPIRRVATIISVLALVVFMGLCLVQVVDGRAGWWEAWKRRRRKGVSSYELPPFQAIVIGAGVVVGLVVTRPMAKWFQVQSPPDVAYGVQHVLRTDFGGQIRLLAFDLGAERRTRGAAKDSSVLTLPEAQAKTGGTLPVVLYWRALEPLSADYSVFLHLDAPNGETYAGADELNPEDIPTSNWPPSLYLRNPLSVALPPDLPPIRYTLTVGLYDAHNGERLPVRGCDGCSTTKDIGDALPLAHVWLVSPRPVAEKDITRRLDYRLGGEITLLGYDLSETDPATLTLFWRANAPVRREYRVFIHSVGADGQVVAQSDKGPLNGLYPTYAWLPGQIIADSHSIGLAESTQALAIGLYDPVSLGRLTVTDASGERVPQDAIRLQVTGDR